MDKDKAQYTLGNSNFKYRNNKLLIDYNQLKSKFIYNKNERFDLEY